MSKGNSLRDEIKAENKKIKDMTFKQKCDHIWEYYKIHICGTLIAVFMILSITIAIKNNHYDTLCTTLVIDGYMTGISDQEDALTKGFTEYLGIDGIKQRVEFNNTFSLIHQEGDLDSYFSYEKIVSMAASSSIDGFMADIEYIDYFSDDEEIFLTDLNELFTKQELEQLKDALVYYTYDDGTKVPYAFDLTDTKIKTETDLSIKNPCYGIVTTAPHKENAVSFIKYAFNMK